MRKVILLILDGAGYHPEPAGNAVTAEHLPNIFKQMESHGFAVLEAAEEAVGLEPGQVGNSESGHLTIGAGRVVPSMCRRIDESFRDGSWTADPGWRRDEIGDVLHIVGLVSDAGVHGLVRHTLQAARAARDAGIPEVVVHPVLDGVDSRAGTAPALLAELRRSLAEIPGVSIGVIQGRKHFCDRSGDLDFSAVAADALTGRSELPGFTDAALGLHLETSGEADFPAHLAPGGRTMALGEAVLHTSHRADRARQIITVLGRSQPVQTLVSPGESVPVKHVYFPQPALDRGLAQEFKRAGLASVRIAEKCKFPHVTFFFNGFDAGTEGQGICLPSIPEGEIPAQPAMSLPEVTEEILAALADPQRRVIVANLANLDQVGHLGRLDLALEAARVVDQAYTRIAASAKANGWTLLLTADHGNADLVETPDGKPFGSHTGRPVPFVAQVADGLNATWTRADGSLANVAATVLSALDLEPPEWMEPSLLTFDESPAPPD